MPVLFTELSIHIPEEEEHRDKSLDRWRSLATELAAMAASVKAAERAVIQRIVSLGTLCYCLPIHIYAQYCACENSLACDCSALIYLTEFD